MVRRSVRRAVAAASQTLTPQQADVASRVSTFAELKGLLLDRARTSDARVLGAWLLGRVPRPRARSLRILRAFVKREDEDVAVRAEALRSLGMAGRRSDLVVLSEVLRSALDVDVRAACVWAIAEIGDRRACADLLAIARDVHEDVKVRSLATEGLAILGCREAVRGVVELLSDRDAQIRFWAAFAAGQIGDRSAIDGLKRLAAERDVNIAELGSVASEAAAALRLLERTAPDDQ